MRFILWQLNLSMHLRKKFLAGRGNNSASGRLSEQAFKVQVWLLFIMRSGLGGIIFKGGYVNSEAIRSKNIFWADSTIPHQIRTKRNGHRGMVVWFTGLSGSGKSTLAQTLERHLFNCQMHVHVLDGDNVRHGLNSNLGFLPDHRVENIR
jgi:predicted alpha/beta-fold hydrolase